MFAKILIIAKQKCLKKIKKISQYNHGEKSMKASLTIANMDGLLEKIDSCHSNH